MKTKFLIVTIPAIAVAVAITGCGGTNAHYIKTGGQQSVVTVGQINIQDFMSAADAATSDLLASGVLSRVTNPPAILAMSRIVNSTSEQIDTDQLTKRIRVALLQSGKAMTTTTFGVGGAEDPLAPSIQQQASHPPDFSLSGRIIETSVRAGSTRQSTFSFQLTLTDQRGLGVWETYKDITKQGTRSAVGF